MAQGVPGAFWGDAAVDGLKSAAPWARSARLTSGSRTAADVGATHTDSHPPSTSARAEDDRKRPPALFVRQYLLILYPFSASDNSIPVAIYALSSYLQLEALAGKREKWTPTSLLDLEFVVILQLPTTLPRSE